jgi:probable phosphoglycerate mutase
MARWYLVRHGDTDWNQEQRIQGQMDVGLNDMGRAEVARTAQRLAGIIFTTVYASDLSRAWETASIILDARPANARPEPRPTRALREISYGAFEGKTWDEIRAMDPRTKDRSYTRDLDFAPDNGESFRQLLQRTGEFGESLVRDHSGENVLVVAHSGSLRALAVRLLGLPDDAFWRIRGMDPAAISILQREQDPPSLIGWNDSGHLQ